MVPKKFDWFCMVPMVTRWHRCTRIKILHLKLFLRWMISLHACFCWASDGFLWHSIQSRRSNLQARHCKPRDLFDTRCVPGNSRWWNVEFQLMGSDRHRLCWSTTTADRGSLPASVYFVSSLKIFITAWAHLKDCHTILNQKWRFLENFFAIIKFLSELCHVVHCWN